MKIIGKLFWWGLASLLGLVLVGIITVMGAYLVIAPELPEVEKLKEVRLQVPLRVYSHEGLLLAEYGEKRRIPVSIEELPQAMVQAFLAAEDDRFYEHPGVDYQGVIRAGLNLVLTGKKTQGASTITMQVAKNFFLSPEKTYRRKIREMFLAFKIEKELTKDEILELYVNKIYLGNRAYGVGAAAQVYYGADVNSLTLPQIAMIAGLPKAPSRFHPIVNPERAQVRRDYVLSRMYGLGFIGKATYDESVAAPLTAGLHSPELEVSAPYVGEMVRAYMVEQYGDEAYNNGFNVYTTIRAELQASANHAIRKGLHDYDMRHGYRGVIGHVDLDMQSEIETWNDLLKAKGKIGELLPALVTKVENKRVEIYLGEERSEEIPWEGIAWARTYKNENSMGPEIKKAFEVVKPGDMVRVRWSTVERIQEKEGKEVKTREPAWVLAQVPEVSGALVSLRADDGAILALTGGYDFYASKFNRAVQAQRQPGSSFKPFIYSAALDRDFTPASIINDAPVVFEDSALEGTWRPENYSGRFYGPTRLRVALTKSRNLVSIRLLRSIGIRYALRHAGKFGFDTSRLPADLSLALGSGTVTPMELARSYAVFANGGYLIEPYFIASIKGPEEEQIYSASPLGACEKACQVNELDSIRLELTDLPDDIVLPEPTTEPVDESLVGEPLEDEIRVMDPAPRVISAENAYQTVSMMKDVVRFGTGRKAMALGRNDLAGKTGTTNDQKDAWFSGYNADVVTTVWIGFDRLKPLGNREAGASAALPLWVDYMRSALDGIPERTLEQPDGLVTVRIDPENGLLAGPNTQSPIFETFRESLVPVEESQDVRSPSAITGTDGPEMPEQLF
jgi:penicillin-binding protein 1A